MNNLKKDILRTIVTAKQGGYKQDYLNALNEIRNIMHKDEYKKLDNSMSLRTRCQSERSRRLNSGEAISVKNTHRQTLGKLPKKREMKTQ